MRICHRSEGRGAFPATSVLERQSPSASSTALPVLLQHYNGRKASLMEQKLFSFAGKILRVDLTSGKIWTEPTADYASRFLGGRGIDNWTLCKEVKPWVAPIS